MQGGEGGTSIHGDPSGEARTVGQGLVEAGQDHLVLAIVDPGDQDLRAHSGDLLRSEVADAENLTADQFLGLVVRGQLRTGGAQAERAEVDLEDVGGFACLGVGRGAEDGADAQFDAFEILPFDDVHADSWSVDGQRVRSRDGFVCRAASRFCRGTRDAIAAG
ncbi:hypothetical protein CRPA12_55320 [Pseudomonas aeruginosa]|nr:hypothetical protein VNPA141581_28600 [Pseudomonas aeruginosa]